MSGTIYLSVKALHVVAVISWMAGLLYLPRLMVYHCGVEAGSEQSETFKIMERRLLKAIMTPAMIVSWLAGLFIAWDGGWLAAGWLHGKLALVVLMTAVHVYLGFRVRDFARDKNTRGHKFYRVINEVPTLLMVVVVVLVVVKPF